MIRRLSAAAGAIMLASSLSRAGVAQATSQDDASFIWSKALAAGSIVSIRNGNGSIDVRESPNDRVEVRAVKLGRRASTRDVTFDVRESSGETMICTVYEGTSFCDDRRRSVRNVEVRVVYTVLIPRSMRLRLNTGNGAIAVDQAGAEVTAATGNGRISIGETTGRVTANTGNGDVQVESARGPVTVNTGNGRVFVATTAGPVSVVTGNGDVTARVKSTPSDAAMTITTGSGSIRVTLPADYSGQLDASTGNGALRSEFEISILGRIDPRHVRGTIGRGGPYLRLQTGNGSVELRKG